MKNSSATALDAKHEEFVHERRSVLAPPSALLADFPVADLMLEFDTTPNMPYLDPTREAEWIVREIIDDYARDLDRTDRAMFLSRLAKLIAERCDLEGEASDETAEQIN